MAVAAAMVLFFTRAYAFTVQFGWADEFLGGIVEASVDDNHGVNNFFVLNHWGGYDWAPPIHDTVNAPLWETVGQQTANAAGRANAREKVMAKIRDATNVGFTVTVNLTRSSVGTPPLEGSACSGTGFTASASQTYDTVSAGAVNWKFNNRLLPVLDFSYETAGTTASVASGYRTAITATTTSGNMGTEFGCYQIFWVNHECAELAELLIRRRERLPNRFNSHVLHSLLSRAW